MSRLEKKYSIAMESDLILFVFYLGLGCFDFLTYVLLTTRQNTKKQIKYRFFSH